MSACLVDSNVLLDVMTVDPSWSVWSSAALAEVADKGRLVINPIVYAEVSIRFSRMEDVDRALAPAWIDREPIPFEAAFLAGKAFIDYRRRGGIRTTPLPDFFVGAHASVTGYRLLTRDAARYRTYFPSLDLVAPDS